MIRQGIGSVDFCACTYMNEEGTATGAFMSRTVAV